MNDRRARIIAEARELADEIRAVADRPLTLMEVCGTHAHQFARYGLARCCRVRGAARGRAARCA